METITRVFPYQSHNRKQRNAILDICDLDGVWQDDEWQIESIIVNYFTDIFHSQWQTDSTTLIDAVEPVVSTNMNDFLTQEFRADEVYKALKQRHPKKSPGLDGMPPLFY